jgi:two-component system LytT family response regulator
VETSPAIALGLDVLVVDDERRALQNLEHLIRREPDVRGLSLCDRGDEAVARILRDRPDLLFLDVQMPEVDGFEVVRRVGVERMPPVVFVTAHDAWAVRAFEINAVDYLLKPVADERFALSMARARGRRAAGEAAALSQRLAALLGPTAPAAIGRTGARVVVRDGARTIVVDPEDIDWISAEDYCIHIFAGARSHVVRCALAAFADNLDASRFVRVHRSAIVNVERIREIKTLPTGRIVLALRGGQTVPVSRARVAALQALVRS